MAEEGCKDYEDIFQNGEEDEFMILDVVMNVVSDEVVLGFFHIDGRKCPVQYFVPFVFLVFPSGISSHAVSPDKLK